jgi:hypothetical protein
MLFKIRRCSSSVNRLAWPARSVERLRDGLRHLVDDWSGFLFAQPVEPVEHAVSCGPSPCLRDVSRALSGGHPSTGLRPPSHEPSIISDITGRDGQRCRLMMGDGCILGRRAQGCPGGDSSSTMSSLGEWARPNASKRRPPPSACSRERWKQPDGSLE